MPQTPSNTTDSEFYNRIIDPGPRRLTPLNRNAFSTLMGWQAIPAIIIGLYLVLGVFGPSLAPFDPQMSDLKNRLCPPLAIDALNSSNSAPNRASECRATNILGTDQIGRDVFSRLLHGARTSLSVVGPSVFIGTVVGVVIGALVNGWRRRPRLVAYAISSFTIVPFAIFVFGQPHTLYIFGVIDSASLGIAVDWSAILALSSFSAVLTFALVAVAYQYDVTCRRSWFSQVDAEDASHGCCQLMHKQFVTLAPWIGLAAFANAALVFLQSGSGAYMSSAITWSFEREYLFDHIGMFSPFVPMVLFPIAFVTFGTWWFVRHIQGRFIASTTASLESSQSVYDGAEELSTEKEAKHIESRSSDNDGNDASTDTPSSVKRRRWTLVVIAIVAAVVVVRFGVAEAVPVVRELAQESAGDYQSASSKSLQGRQEVLRCAQELSSKLMTLRTSPLEQPGVESSQHCLDLYFEHRNAPSHRLTIDFALHFLSQTLTLALAASIVSAVLWTTALASTRAVKRTVEVFVALVTVIGLTITFGIAGWSLIISYGFYTFDLVIYDKWTAITQILVIFRNFSVALGISYLTIAIVKPAIRFGKPVLKFEVLSDWASIFVPCVMLTSGLLIVFHYHFPTIHLFLDEQMGVIVNPTEEFYISSFSLVRYWLWTYWFALIGYAAIVFGFFAAAIWGFGRSAVNGHFYR